MVTDGNGMKTELQQTIYLLFSDVNACQCKFYEGEDRAVKLFERRYVCAMVIYRSSVGPLLFAVGIKFVSIRLTNAWATCYLSYFFILLTYTGLHEITRVFPKCS